MSERTFQKMLIWSVVAPFVLTAVSGAAFVGLILYHVSLTDWVDHTDRVINQARLTQQLMLDANASLHGYLLTGKQPDLVPFQNAVKQIPDEIATLKKMVGDDKAQLQLINAINSDFLNWMERVEHPDRTKSFFSFVVEGEGQSLRNSIRLRFNDLLEAENTLRHDRVIASNGSTLAMLVSIVVASFISGGVLALLGRRQLLVVSQAYEDGLRLRAMQNERLLKQQQELDAQKNLLQAKMAELQAAKDAAEASNRSKSNFLANMSHEIRTPLGAMVGFSELLQQEGTSVEERSEYIEIIRRNSLALARLIDDILDLSKVEAERLDLENLEFNPQELVQDVVDLLSSRAHEKNIYMDVEMRGDFPHRVIGDPMRLRQILVNVIGNALKFTDNGGISIGHEMDSESHEWRIFVKDTGIGIGPDHQMHLFQPFMQGDSSMTRKFGGTGLGLALSRRLARLMGGDLELLESTPQLGSTFKITAKLQMLPGAEGQPIAVADVQDLLKGLKLLLIEDARDNQLLIKVLLEKSGASVDLAENGLEGARKAIAGHYDLVLVDIQMPVLDGYGATRWLRQNHFMKPIVAISAHAMRGERERCLEIGCNDYLVKPVDRVVLVKTVAKYARTGPEIRAHNLSG